MKKDIKNLQASIRSRLQNKAKEVNCSFAEILQYYAMERFLYRFSASEYADKFILKGALMFVAWQIAERRTTLDIDFSGLCNNEAAYIEKIVKIVCETSVVPDGLVFDSNTVKGQKIKENADYEGVRVKFIGFLGRSRIPMQIDIGFGDIIYPKPQIVDYPVILNFPKPHLKGYSAESVIGEKFEAIVKLGLLNSRMKDFYDIWLMMSQFNFNGSQLSEALRKTFNHRKTFFPQGRKLFAEEIYNEKSDRQALWKAFLNKNDIQKAPKKLSIIAGEIERFLIMPVDAIRKNYKLNKAWKPLGQWK